MKRTILSLAILSLIITPAAFAGSATANLNVSASVAAVCTINTSPVAFGAYDPVVANAATALSGTGTVTVACTKGASATVDLGVGNNLSGGSRRMAAGANYLNYALYQDGTHTTVWGSAMTGGSAETYNSTTKAPTALTVYGSVPAGQDVAVGSYSDVVVATINY